MSGATADVTTLAERLGVSVNWEAFHQKLSTREVVWFVNLAAEVSFAESSRNLHQQHVNEALDASAGGAGLNETEQDFACLFADVLLTTGGRADSAVEQARSLVAPLKTLGVLR